MKDGGEGFRPHEEPPPPQGRDRGEGEVRIEPDHPRHCSCGECSGTALPDDTPTGNSLAREEARRQEVEDARQAGGERDDAAVRTLGAATVAEGERLSTGGAPAPERFSEASLAATEDSLRKLMFP